MFKIRAVLIIVLVVLGNTLAISRNIDGYENDTVRPADTVYSLGDIPIVSAELISQTRQEIVDLIPDGTIKKLKAHNTLLLASIHPELLVPVDSTDPSKNISFLKIRIMDLTQAQRKTEEEISALSGIVQNLDQIKSRLTHQLVKWTNTRVKLERDSTVIKAPVKLYETLDFLDSTLILITRKSSAIMEVLDKTIATNAIIEAQIAKAHELITSKQLQAFNSDHPGFFSLDFSRMFGSEIFNAFETFSKMNVDDFVHYMKTHGNIGFFILLLFGFFVYLFVIIRKKVVIRNTGFGYFYKEMIKRVIDHPVSASIILVMLFSMGLFPDRPLLFRELTFYIIAFPVIQLTSNLLPKRYHSYIYAFGAIIIFYVLILVFPSEFVIYRVLLLFISIAEIVLLTMFVIYFFKKQELEKSRKQLIYFFVYLHLALAVVGFISNLAGRVTLTEIVIFAIFSNIFFGLAIFIGVILLNGIVVSMVDNYRKPRLNVFKLYGEEIKRKAIYLFNALALVFWIGIILKNFLLLKFIYEGIISIFTQKIVLGSTSFSFDTIIIFFIVIYVSIVFASLLRVVLEEDVLKRFSLSKGLPHTIAMMVKYTMIVAGFILAINAAGIPMDKLTIILGAFSVGIGFGLQNIFNNLVSGFILLLERPIQLGDTVQVGLLTGNVKSIGIRSSNILTFDGADVIVPNGQLVSNEVINWTLSDPKRRIEIPVGVSYKSDPALVQQLLSNILNSHPDVLKDPEPLVFFDGLGESSLDFILLYWISDNLETRRIKSEILFRIFAVLKENNIEIPFPQRDIHLRTVAGDGSINPETSAAETKSRKLKN